MINQLLFLMLLPSAPQAQNELAQVPEKLAFERHEVEQNPVATGAKIAELSKQHKKLLVDRLADEIERKYVFAEVAKTAAQHLRSSLKNGKYDEVRNPIQMATKLTEDAQAVTHDKHLRVFYDANSQKVDSVPAPLTDEERVKRRNEVVRYYQKLNYGVRRVERFDGNIAYLDLFMFGELAYVGNGISAAMVLLEGSDAMIIDLRDNSGGSPETVNFIISHFVERPTHVMDNYRRDDDSIRQSWTSSYLNVPVYDRNKKVYILTSSRTFSAPEDLAYTMQALKRAKIVGETTGGGAHAGTRYALDENFTAFIPNQRSISPITKTNWEGVGVVPDLQVEASKALLTVRIEILQERLQKVTHPQERSDIVESILALKVAMKKL